MKNKEKELNYKNSLIRNMRYCITERGKFIKRLHCENLVLQRRNDELMRTRENYERVIFRLTTSIRN